MSENTKIEWADNTFNPWIGCTQIAPGCDGCYAKAFDRRFEVSGHAMHWGAGVARRRTSEANWGLPLRWDRAAKVRGIRTKVFCASLADVFDNEVPVQWRMDLFKLIADTPNLDWLVLTKRVGNALQMLRDHRLPVKTKPWPWPNVWIGATICNQEEANRDIPKLLGIPAAKRFLSIEPLLGPVRLNRLLIEPLEGCSQAGQRFIDWVIVGGESGPNARPMHPDWARSLRDQCESAGVPFLFKQWGQWAPALAIDENDERELQQRWIRHDGITVGEDDIQFFGGDEVVYQAGKKAAGRLLDGREWNEVPT